jgi:predicted acyl esterase
MGQTGDGSSRPGLRALALEATPRDSGIYSLPEDDDPPFTDRHKYFAQHGYIGARLDCRGTGAGEGINQHRQISLEDRS